MADETLQQDEPEVVETQDDETETPEGESPQEEVENLVVEIDGDVEDEPEHFREVRRKYREAQKRIKELEATTVAAPAVELPPKPTLEECDYDAADFEKKLEGWYDKKREHDARQAEQKTVAERAEQRWQQRLSHYDEGKTKLAATDYEEAESTAAEILAAPFPGIVADDVRIGIIKQGAKDPAALVYALGKNPAKAKELAAIEDPVEFAWKAAALEASMKVVRGKAPPPERKVSGGVPGIAGALDNTLERLREEAAKTGNYSKVTAYKRQKRA